MHSLLFHRSCKGQENTKNPETISCFFNVGVGYSILNLFYGQQNHRFLRDTEDYPSTNSFAKWVKKRKG